MHSINAWKFAESPNYISSVDKEFPYSEVPYIGGYKLIKLPKEGLTQLVDYWGEGAIHAEEGVSGFADSYNVNHEYQLVSNGPDRGKKIPNRIPVISYTNCNTRAYIKDDSVKEVTVMGAPINKSCADDIARIVNREVGKVIIYGFNDKSADVKNLKDSLSKKGILPCFGYEVTELFKSPTLFDSHKVFLNIKDLSDELYNSVTAGLYDKAVNVAKTLDVDGNGSLVAEIVDKMLQVAIKNVVGFAHKLANENGLSVVNNYFPGSFSLLISEQEFRIIHKGTLKEIKIDVNNNVVMETKDLPNHSFHWKAIPVWKDNSLVFKIKNTKNNFFLTVSKTVDLDGDRKVFGTLSDDSENSTQWVMEPLKVDDDVIFFIIHKEYKQGLTVKDKGDNSGLFTHNGSVYGNNDSFGWFIAPVD